jgi:hypothetical protein
LPSLSSPALRFVVCIDNGGYADLDPLKVYRVKPDKQARAMGLLRVIDASGEDYLYPVSYFQPVSVSPKIFEQVKQSA